MPYESIIFYTYLQKGEMLIMLTQKHLIKIQELSDKNPEAYAVICTLNEEHQSILSNMNHEIRNYLTLIHSTAQLIETKNSFLAEDRLWVRMTTDIKDVSNLLKDFSYYNHCETLHIVPTDLIQLLQNTIDSFEAPCLEKQVTLTFHADDTVKDYLLHYPCDPYKLKEVFVNIIKNALEATSQNDFIHITCKNVQYIPNHYGKQLSFLPLMISNNGKAIPKEDIEHLFLPNFTTKSYGTGLGLSISQKIIQAHNGSIQVDSDGMLTSFTIYLPLD